MAAGTDYVVRAQNLESSLHAMERVPSEGRGNHAQFMPIPFVLNYKLSLDDKLLLASTIGASTVAMNVFGTVITSSPGPMPNARRASQRASAPLPIPWLCSPCYWVSIVFSVRLFAV